MVEVILKDGKVLEVAEGITLAELAKKISSSLKAAIAARVDGKLVDLSYVVNEKVNVEFVVDGDPDYFHILNCICVYQSVSNHSCTKRGDIV
jgi:threonyl-tRNA synthetase